MKTHSWVIIEKSTGIAVLETYKEDIAQKINLEKFKVVPILEYLQSLNMAQNDNRLSICEHTCEIGAN